MRLKLISCEIFFYEVKFLKSLLNNKLDVEFLSKGLHDIKSSDMLKQLQDAVDRNDNSNQYDYILLGYGLCNNGVSGLKSNNIPLVIPRVHDCIAVLMGSLTKYQKYFDEHPGCYYLSPGWVEFGIIDDKKSIQSQIKMNQSYEYFLNFYGEDNAQFLYEQLSAQTNHYSELTYIKTGTKKDSFYKEIAEQEALDKKWDFLIYEGSLCFLKRFLSGDWNDEEFIIINPGSELKPSYDSKVFKKYSIS